MSIPTANRSGPAESVSHLLSLGLTQLSIQVTLSTRLTASALGLATFATALTSIILTVQGTIAPYWQWTLLPSVAATIFGLFATTAVGAECVGAGEVYAAHEAAASRSEDVGLAVLGFVRGAFVANDRSLVVKERLMVATLAMLLLSLPLIGVLNLVSATLHS
ncbi:MAG: hypothetical protein WBQ21_13245 [Solirubrobacteraceae bacterium]